MVKYTVLQPFTVGKPPHKRALAKGSTVRDVDLEGWGVTPVGIAKMVQSGQLLAPPPAIPVMPAPKPVTPPAAPPSADPEPVVQS